MLKGRGRTVFWVVLTQELEALAIMKWGGGGLKKFPPFKIGGTHKVLPCLEGGGARQIYITRC